MDMDIIHWRSVEKSSWARGRYFDHTKIICQRRGTEDDFYHGVSRHRYAEIQANPELIGQIQLERIPNHSIFPMYEGDLSIAPDPLPYNVYLKSPKLIDYGDSNIAAKFLHEARVCEILKAHPHPNVAVYHGCIVKDGMITALCFARYPLTLEQRGNESIPIDIDHCTKFVGKAAKHLHSLGLAHNNIQPSNIMMQDNMPILIDFQSTLKFGESLKGWRAGSPPWTDGKGTTSSQYIDHYATRQIYSWLRELRDG